MGHGSWLDLSHMARSEPYGSEIHDPRLRRTARVWLAAGALQGRPVQACRAGLQRARSASKWLSRCANPRWTGAGCLPTMCARFVSVVARWHSAADVWSPVRTATAIARATARATRASSTRRWQVVHAGSVARRVHRKSQRAHSSTTRRATLCMGALAQCA